MWCWYYKWRFETDLDNPQKDTQKLSGHMQTCPSCRQYAQSLLRLHKQLTWPANETVCGSQIDRIKTAVMQQLPADNPAPAASVFSLKPILATAACLLILAGLWKLYVNVPHPPFPQPDPSPTKILSLNPQSIDTVMTLIARLPDNTFKQEILNLKTDTHRALSTLQACLPQPPISTQSTQN